MRESATETPSGAHSGQLEESVHGSRETADSVAKRFLTVSPGTDGALRHTQTSTRTGSMPQTPNVNSEASREGNAGVAPAGAPAQRDVLNHANFGLLPEDKRRFGSFGVAAGVNIALVALLLVLTIDQVHEARVHRQEQLVYLAPPPKPYVPPVPKIKMPPIPPLPKEEAKIPPPPKPVIEPPKVELPKVAAKAPAMPAPAPRPVVTPPKPILGAFKSPEAPAQQAPRVAAAQAAGFGAPTGVQANPNANRPSQLAAVGAFGAAANSNQGAASRQGAVATTGFGSGAPSGSPNGSARGAVASTGFGAGSQPAGVPGGRGRVAGGVGGGRGDGGLNRVWRGFSARRNRWGAWRRGIDRFWAEPCHGGRTAGAGTGAYDHADCSVVEAAAAVHRRGAGCTCSGRCNPRSPFHGRGASGSAACSERTGAWTRRAGAACRGENPLQTGDAGRQGGRPGFRHPRRVSACIAWFYPESFFSGTGF